MRNEADGGGKRWKTKKTDMRHVNEIRIVRLQGHGSEKETETKRERGEKIFPPRGPIRRFSLPPGSPSERRAPLRCSCATRIGALRARDACLLVSYSLSRATRTHVRSSPRPIQAYVRESVGSPYRLHTRENSRRVIPATVKRTFFFPRGFSSLKHTTSAPLSLRILLRVIENYTERTYRPRVRGRSAAR